MNKLLVQIGYALGGLSLFVSTFFVFALLSGTPLHEMALLGKFVPAPPEPEPVEAAQDETPAEDEPTPPVEPTPADRLAGAAGILGVFQIPSPLSAEELQALARELESKRVELDARLAELEAREERLALREEALEERYEELGRLRQMLEDLENELDLRREEVEAAEAARRAAESERWKRVAKWFEEGEVEELVRQLTQFSPDEAALILRNLPDPRAGELLRAVPEERYRESVDAYMRIPGP